MKRSMALGLLCLIIAAVPHVKTSSALLTATKVGPNIAISTWTGCRANVYRDAVLATSPLSYLRMSPVGSSEPSLGTLNKSWFWTNVPGSTAGAIACDAKAAVVMSATQWLSSEHVVWILGDTVSFSYALWFKAGATSQGVLFSSAAGLLASGATSRADRALWISPDGLLSFALSDGPVTKWVSTATAVTDNRWHFAVVTMRANDSGSTRGSRLYLDGVQVAYDSQMRKGLSPTAAESWRAGPAALATAVGTLAPKAAFDGALDEIAVWDGVLSDAQIATIWAARNG